MGDLGKVKHSGFRLLFNNILAEEFFNLSCNKETGFLKGIFAIRTFESVLEMNLDSGNASRIDEA